MKRNEESEEYMNQQYCQKCGETMFRSKQAKYCYECQDEIRQEHMRERHRKHGKKTQ